MLSTYLYKQRSVDLYPLEATEESSTHKKKKRRLIWLPSVT